MPQQTFGNPILQYDLFQQTEGVVVSFPKSVLHRLGSGLVASGGHRGLLPVGLAVGHCPDYPVENMVITHLVNLSNWDAPPSVEL